MKRAILLASLFTFGCSRPPLTGTAIAPPAQPGEHPASAARTLDGTYRLHKTFVLGDWMYSGERQDFEVVIKGETLTRTGKSWRGDPTTTIKTDPSKNPATIDLIEKIEGKVEVYQGIYKLDGDELMIVTGKKADEENRPKDFTPSDEVSVEVYKRK